LGYSDTDIAHDGIEAVQMSVDKPYDIILMDINMPRQDGIQSIIEYFLFIREVYGRIREREKN